MTLNLALVLSGESSGATRATKETRDEVRELGAEAGRTQAAITAANDQATASARRATEALTGQTAAQREMNAAVAAFAGIRPANDDAAYRRRAGDIAAYGAELDRLRAKYDPLFAVQRRSAEALAGIEQARRVGAISAEVAIAATLRETAALNAQVSALNNVSSSRKATVEAMVGRVTIAPDRGSDIDAYGQELDRLRAKFNPIFAASKQYEAEVEELANAHKVGAISGAEYDAELVRINERYTLLARQSTIAATGMTGVGGAARLTSIQMLNLSRQGNDVITMFALGASPMQIFASQAGQIYDALESGPQGLRGSLEAITIAGRNALSALLAFATTPPGLVAGATLAAVAGLATYIIKTKEDIRDLDEILKDHENVIKGIADAYGLVQSKAHGAFSFNTRDSYGLSASANQNELRLALARSVRGDLSDILINRGGGASGNQFGPAQIVSSQYAAFSDAIDHLRTTARQGQPDILGFKKMVEERWALEPNNEALTRTAGKLVDMVKDSLDAARALKELDEAKRKFDQSVGPGGIPLRRGALSTEDTGAYSQYLAAQRVELERAQQAFDAQLKAIYARSPAEIGAAARAAASAQYNDDEDPQERRRRIDQAGTLAELQAHHQLDEAQKERKRSLDATLASQQLDLQLIGRTAGEAAQMRLQFQLTQQLREEAERNNVKIDQDELDRITAKARAYGDYADKIAKANLVYSLQQERDQLGRSPIEQTVASRLQGAGLKVDLGSYEAGLIRSNEILKQHVETWKDVRKTGMDAIDAVTDSAAKGFSNFGDAVEDIAEDVTKQLAQLVVANPLKNAIYGAGLPTINDVGGVGGFLGTLFGLTPNPASGASALGGQSVGAMTVNAGTVMVTGSIGVGGGENLLPRLFAPANSNAQGGSVESQIWNFFSGKGLQPHQVAGIMGNISAESSFNPSATNPTSGAYGLFQNLGSRLLGLGNGADLSRQLEYAWQELLGPENRVLKNLLGSTDVRGATGAFGGFERAEGFSWANPEGIDRFGARLEGAEAALAKFSGVTTAAGGAAGDFGQGLKAGLGQFGDGLSDLWSKLGSFLQSANGGGSSWFQGLSSAFGGAGGAFNYMNSISPLATADILSGSWGLFDKGGATGGNDARRVAGFVHEKEYVLDEPIVRAVGVPFLDNFRQAVKAGRGFAGGGYGGGPMFPSDVRGSRSAGTVVNIFDQREAGAPAVEQQERIDENGQRQLDVYIRRTTQDEVNRPSAATNRQLRGTYGLAPQVVRR